MISSKKAYCLLGVGVFFPQGPIFFRKCGGESGGRVNLVVYVKCWGQGIIVGVSGITS